MSALKNATADACGNATGVAVVASWWEAGKVQIPLYSVIFLLAVAGNGLVILTLIKNQSMRTITNVFLLNLAVSDLLLGVLCMPFTLVGTILRDFVFGDVMCKLIPFFQGVSPKAFVTSHGATHIKPWPGYRSAPFDYEERRASRQALGPRPVATSHGATHNTPQLACRTAIKLSGVSSSSIASSVSVSAWTLVCISVERYYAICHPLRSRRWQTLSHSYKLIAAIWIASLFVMAPIAWLSELIPTSQGHHKCREIWPSLKYERVYNLMLDAVLLVLPLLALIGTYSSITQTLRKGMRPQYPIPGTAEVTRHMGLNGCASLQMNTSFKSSGSWSNRGGSTSPGLLRRSNTKKALTKKKRVIKMLCAVVLEFFICWTPLYIINTIALFEPAAVYNTLGYQTISFFQLLAYSSSCCNPITYCFMNSSFRKAFLKLFGCLRRERTKRPY